jgi:uncharacterized protein (TIGR02266 family)
MKRMGEASLASSAAPVIALRVTVRAPDLESFIDRYSKHIDGDRIFIFTKNPQAIGTRVRFTLALASGEELIHGKGTVTRVQSEGNARRPPGMELVFVALDDRSQTLVDFMLASRQADAPPIVRAVAAVPEPRPLPPLPPAVPAPEAAPKSESAPNAAERPSSIATHLAEKLGPAVPKADVTPGPAPAFAEKWREPMPPGAPAAGTDSNVPANPFSEISDGAIEYFVEWSLDQSIGARAQQNASFSDVAMALPHNEVAPVVAASPSRRVWLIGAGCFVAGLSVGLLMLVLPRAPRAGAAIGAVAPVPPPVVSAPAAAAPAPVGAVAPAPVAAVAPALPTAVAAVDLAVVTRPPGASVRVDGAAVGKTPLVAKVAPGRHEISVAKERYESQTTATDAPNRVQLNLKRPTATLNIVSTPPQAQVSVDGVRHGHTPATVRLPAFESYTVEVAYAGARRWRKSIYVHAPASSVTATLVMVPTKPAAGRRSPVSGGPSTMVP